MQYKYYLLVILIAVLFLTAAGTSLATEEEIQNLIPQPLIDLFNIFSNWKIDFSRIPIINRIPEYLPRSGKDVGQSFQWLSGGLSNFNNWLTSHIGLNVLLVIKKVGEFFVWALEFLVRLIKIGLSFI